MSIDLNTYGELRVTVEFKINEFLYDLMRKL